MIKRRIVATLLVASVFASPTPVLADHSGEPLYNITFYSDSTYTQVVGYDPGYCAYFGPSYGHTGQATEYSVYDYIGHCEGGYLWPIH